MNSCILTTDMLKRSLGDGNEMITVTLENEEYVIDHIKNVKNYAEPSIHKTLVIRNGGNGELKR